MSTTAPAVPVQRKDKKQVLDEVWTEDRVRAFLDLQAPTGIDPEFHRLLRAYQSMRLEDFELFVGFVQEAGGRLDATGPRGETVLDIVSSHRHGAPFAEALKAAGTNR